MGDNQVKAHISAESWMSMHPGAKPDYREDFRVITAQPLCQFMHGLNDFVSVYRFNHASNKETPQTVG